MDENRKNEFKEDIPAPVSIKLSEKAENFWYHYKWHTIAAIIIVIIVTVCTIQMCQKESYDAYILYAGSHEVKKTSSDGSTPPYAQTVSSLKRVSDDFNKNGEITINLKDLFLLTADEIKKVESETGLEVNYTLISENSQLLKDSVVYSEYYLCFLSKDIYEQYKIIDGVYIFKDLSEYVSAYDVDMYDSSALYLSSTEFYTLPGISDFPEDTVVCIRNISPIASHWDKDGSEAGFAAAEAILKKIIAYQN